MNIEDPENVKGDNLIAKAKEKIYYSPGRIGLFVGVPGFFLVSFISFGGSCCGGVLSSVVIGAIAGWFTAHYSNIGFWANAPEFGGKAGRIAGIFVLCGHIVGAVLPILLIGMGGLLGVFQNSDVYPFAELHPQFMIPGIINGIIGLIITWISASAVTPRVYENVQKENL